MADRTYGDIPGFPAGSTFTNRRDLSASRVHRPLQGGICGGVDGAESIVVSGGYVDDIDDGDEIVYTGQGGQDLATKRQVADQELTRGNIGLARSQLDGYPVRVIRGAGGDRSTPPTTGLRYDGLYRVTDHWHDTGQDGYRIWRFRLTAVGHPGVSDSLDVPPTAEDVDQPTRRAETVSQRIVRRADLALRVKRLHDFTCQVCQSRLLLPAGPYAEGAHIKPLGAPHDGPDVLSNLLCLCPNHHVLFDAGAIYVDTHGVVRDSSTHSDVAMLRQVRGHAIDLGQIAYHRSHHAL